MRAIYNRLPFRIRNTMRQKLYQFSYYYALDKILERAEMLDSNTFVVELVDGAIFYGRRDKTPMPNSILHKLPKLKALKGCDIDLSMICYQYVGREYEKHYEIKRGDVVVDVGANIGTFTVKSARAVGCEGLVVAIEPEGKNFMFLRDNIGGNVALNTQIIQKGVWKEKGVLPIKIAEHQGGHSFGEGSGYNTKYTAMLQMAEVDTLDGILAPYIGEKPVDFLKVDIEGAEAVAMQGMATTLSRCRNAVFEVAHSYDGQPTDAIVESFLRDAGFNIKVKNELVYAWRES